MELPEMCIDHTRKKIISLEANKHKITFLNPNRWQIQKILVDGCVIKEGLRCDWLLIDRNLKEYFIELKGRDVKHAISQLATTINVLSKTMNRVCFVVCSGYPKNDTRLQRQILRFRNDFNTILRIKVHRQEFTVS